MALRPVPACAHVLWLAGLVSKIVVQEEHHILIDTAQFFVVQVTTRTPGVPFGGHFATLVQYKLLSLGSNATQVEVTGGTVLPGWVYCNSLPRVYWSRAATLLLECVVCVVFFPLDVIPRAM